jgi:hypothetical protein
VKHCIAADTRSSVHTATKFLSLQENKDFVALGSLEKIVEENLVGVKIFRLIVS